MAVLAVLGGGNDSLDGSFCSSSSVLMKTTYNNLSPRNHWHCLLTCIPLYHCCPIIVPPGSQNWSPGGYSKRFFRAWRGYFPCWCLLPPFVFTPSCLFELIHSVTIQFVTKLWFTSACLLEVSINIFKTKYWKPESSIQFESSNSRILTLPLKLEA